MAGVNGALEVRGQVGAIAALRWQMFRNSLRTIRGRLEVVARVFVGVMMAVAWFGVGIGLGMAAYAVVLRERAEWLALLLWVVFLFWQLFPLLASAFSISFDSTNLLRFPLPFSTFFLVALAYGLFDPASIAGCFWLACIAGGIGWAKPGLLFVAIPTLLIFAAVNLLLGRVIYAWLERWLAQRRTREILGVVSVLVILGFQLIGPIAGRWGHQALPMAARLALLLPYERILPPGLAGSALSAGAGDQVGPAFAAAAFLLAYGILFAGLLGVRLRAEFLGESLGESASVPAAAPGAMQVRLGWRVPGLPGPIAAILEKEFRYLSRSGPMLFNLVMPLFMIVIFSFTPGFGGDRSLAFSRAPDLMFLIGAGYALLMLTNLAYNSFGFEGSGIQVLLAAPVRFREILLAKNLAHSGLLVLETALVWLGVRLLLGPPSAIGTLTAVAALFFALPVNLAAGNLLSLHFPKKLEFSSFGRQRASGTTIFASMGIQIAVIGLAAGTLALARFFDRLWLAVMIFVVLAAVAWLVYWRVLGQCERLAIQNREVLTAALCRN
jgi:ABC-2 type transport system permease protein